MMGRCADCFYWTEPDRPWADGVVDQSEKICGLAGARGSKVDLAVKWCEVGPWLITEPDFGCVQWTARPAKSL